MRITRLGPQLDPGECGQLEAVLDDLCRRVVGVLREQLVGVYLKGSFALGSGDVHADVDFLVATAGPLAPAAEAGVRELHASVPDRVEHWAHVLEGSYADVADLRERGDPARPWLYVDNGQREMDWSAHDNTEVFRWVLHHRAITLVGRPAYELVDDVPVDVLRSEVAALALARRDDVAADPEYLLNAWGQPHEVLTRCRMLFTASTGAVAGKDVAARWCVDAVPRRWHALIERAVADRPDPWGRVHRAGDPALAGETWEFVEWVTARVIEVVRNPV